jgi:hypothetical protein
MNKALATMGSARPVVSFAGEAGQLVWRRWARGWRFEMIADSGQITELRVISAKRPEAFGANLRRLTTECDEYLKV